MWFSENDFSFVNKTLKKEEIYGYVLPHAGTQYTSEIYTHTLQYIPKNQKFKNVYIFYYPANETENVTENSKKYYHEYYVPMKSLKYIFKHWWKIDDKQFVGINVRDNPKNMRNFNLENNLIIISADFSHFLDMKNAIEIENKAALSLIFKTQHESQKHVDNMTQFEYVFQRLPETHTLKWIGRTRSPNLKGVGYLSFLINKQFQPATQIKKPDGYFITVYDRELNARECLGQWTHYTKQGEEIFLQEVKQKGQTTSRLTNHSNTHIPIQYYKITYLFKEKQTTTFSRGYHGVRADAFYLPEVFLENTYENGKWIKPVDVQWDNTKSKTRETFDMSETLQKLMEKSGNYQTIIPTYYKTRSYYGEFTNS